MPFAHSSYSEDHGSRRAVDPYSSTAYEAIHNHPGSKGGFGEVDVIVCEWAEWITMDESRDPAWASGKWADRGLVVATRVGVTRGAPTH